MIILDRTTAQIVLDPFQGCGTTAVAAKERNRDCRGIEISQNYCDMAQRRLNGEEWQHV